MQQSGPRRDPATRWHAPSIPFPRSVGEPGDLIMNTTDELWRDFLAFCAGRTPDDWLALDFVQFATADLSEPVRRQRAEADLHVLQVLLTWRAKRSSHPEKRLQQRLSVRLRRTG